MTKHWKKSLKKAHEKTYFKHPAYYCSVGILTAWLLVACGGDSGWDIPTPTAPTKGVNKAPTMQLADTLKFDLKNKPTTAIFKKKLLEMIADDNTSDDKLTLAITPTLDFSKEGTTSVTVKATDDGKDSKGKMGEKKSSTAKTVVKVADTREVTASFPKTLPWTEDNKIVIADKDFFNKLFDFKIPLSNWKTILADKILVNDKEIEKNGDFSSFINTFWNCTIDFFVLIDGKEQHMKYTGTIVPQPIIEHELSWYIHHYEKVFPRLDLPSVIMEDINAISEKMKLGSFMELTSKVLKPSGKNTAMVENREKDHIFFAGIDEILKGNNEIVYKWLGKDMPRPNDDPEFSKELKNILQQYDFVTVEDNSGNNREPIRENVDIYNNIYLFTGEGDEEEKRSLKGKSIVNFPTIVWPDGKLYTSYRLGYWNIEANPLINSIDSKILWGLPFWWSSGTTAGNAAVGALIWNFYHRLWKKIDKWVLDDILKNHPEIMQEVRYAYYPKWVKHIPENVVWDSSRIVAQLIDLEKLAILVAGVFDLNSDLEHLEELSEVPLFKYYDKLNYSYIILGKEKGIVWKEEGGQKVPYVSFDKLKKQKLTLNDIAFDIIVGEKDSDTYFMKLENWNLR